MTKIDTLQIKKLRVKTKAGVMDCRKALGECKGDLKKAEEWLRKKGIESASKKVNRKTSQGLIGTYSHHDGSIVSVASVACETDFVARTKEFKDLVHELAMQVAATDPKDIKDLLKQPWIRDEKRTINDLIKEIISKTGENIVVKRIARFELGED